MERDTILFDLDGTLLPIDFDEFLHRYFKSLTGEFTDIAEPDRFIEVLLKATSDMIDNQGERLNREVFMDSFFSLIKVDDREALMRRFDRFYEEKFPLLRKGLVIDTTPARIIDFLKKKGYQLIIATNPVFPLEAITERISWGRLDPDDFVLITHYENMHYCKPNPGFFREIMDKLDLEPERCIMVGNDMQEDMVAGKLGMATYLVEDHLIDRHRESFIPDWRGTLNELELYLKEIF